MTIKLKEHERIDNLERNGYQIIQDSDKFCFGMDAVLLSGFAKVKPGGKVLDLGTGTGIIPILMEAKTQGEHFTGLEIQEESADMDGEERRNDAVLPASYGGCASWLCIYTGRNAG